jgi:hypothetical protein
MVQSTHFHVRVKRDKTTLFIECQGTDTVISLRHKIAAILNKSAKELRLTSKEQLLEDPSTLATAGITLDSIIGVQYWITNDQDSAKSAWEPLKITPFPVEAPPQ